MRSHLSASSEQGCRRGALTGTGYNGVDETPDTSFKGQKGPKERSPALLHTTRRETGIHRENSG